MGSYILRRFLYMLLLLAMGSVVSFIILHLPPGDYLTSYVTQLRAQGRDVSDSEVASLRNAYGLDQPAPMQYLIWMKKIVTEGDFGKSFAYRRQVGDLIWERLGYTLIVALGSTVMVYLVAIPIGIYSATHQYSLGDYVVTLIGFTGLAVPSFILALVVMLFVYANFGVSVGGLFSPQYEGAAWSWAKFVDMLTHLPVPILVIAMAGTASIIRVMRATLLDELNKPYVETARAKGLGEAQLLFRYPVRIALNPIASTIGWVLPSVFSGATIVAIVLNLPTIGPLLFQSLLTQDMYLAASTVFITIALTVVGTFLSDMILVWLDPRIRLERGT